MIEKIKNLKDYDYLNLIKWRLNILNAISDLDQKNTKNIFKENILKIRNENLKFLSAKLTIVYGLYYFRKTKDKNILEEGINELKSLRKPGLLSIFKEAIETIK